MYLILEDISTGVILTVLHRHTRHVFGEMWRKCEKLFVFSFWSLSGAINTSTQKAGRLLRTSLVT